MPKLLCMQNSRLFPPAHDIHNDGQISQRCNIIKWARFLSSLFILTKLITYSPGATNSDLFKYSTPLFWRFSQYIFGLSIIFLKKILRGQFFLKKSALCRCLKPAHYRFSALGTSLKIAAQISSKDFFKKLLDWKNRWTFFKGFKMKKKGSFPGKNCPARKTLDSDSDVCFALLVTSKHT